MTWLREHGVSIGQLETGPLNAITDVAGVRVGHTTLIYGRGPRRVGHGPVRTGVTVIQPRSGLTRDQPCFAGASTLNGNGEMTGLEWVRESGLLTTPIALTNTYSVGVVRDALAAWDTANHPDGRYWSLPVVGETCDDLLNDIRGHHVAADHLLQALQVASTGRVAEGSVGGGTGMVCHEFKGGIGTSSRKLPAIEGGWSVGVLVQANYGTRSTLRIAGMPIGLLIPTSDVPAPRYTSSSGAIPPGSGSIITIVCTDAPLLPDQCRRLAARATVGLSRVGGATADSSGDLMFCFSTGNNDVPAERYDLATPTTFPVSCVPHQRLSLLFEAVADATEEAILNSLLTAGDLSGPDDVMAYALPHDRLETILSNRAC